MSLADLFTAAAPDAVKVGIPFWLELLSVVVGGITGGIAASERKLDFVGATALAVICGLGGGLIRDISMQVGEVYMLSSDLVLLSTIAGGLFAYFFSGIFDRLSGALHWLDIFSVALFTVTGADKALVFGFSPVVAVFMGVITGVGGGMLRDVLTGEVPHIFQGGTNLYAACSAVGGIVYCVCVMLQFRKAFASLICIVVTVAMRWASLQFNIVSPEPTDFTPKVVEAGKRAVRFGIESGKENAKSGHKRGF